MWRIPFTAAAPLTAAASATAAGSVIEECRPLQRELQREERALAYAQRFLERQRASLYSLTERIETQSSRLSYGIQRARDFAAYDRARSYAYATRCWVWSFFGYVSFQCFNNANYYNYNREVRNQFNISQAIYRYESYQRYAQGEIERQAQRVVIAEQSYEDEAQRYTVAFDAYQSCINRSAP